MNYEESIRAVGEIPTKSENWRLAVVDAIGHLARCVDQIYRDGYARARLMQQKLATLAEV